MEMGCDLSAAAGYWSATQIARVLSESWFRKYAYCLACSSEHLSPTPANTKASDFQCQSCHHGYELKSFLRPSRKIVDGAFGAMMGRIERGTAPTLMLLERTADWQIRNLTAVHYLFLTPEVLEKRRPLSPVARRAGWIGCNIRLDLIGSDARIDVIQDGIPLSVGSVREEFRRYEPLKGLPGLRRGWTTLTLDVIRKIHAREFSLDDIYSQESVFFARYPDNNNVRPKIRQQLQVLRDLGYLKFVGKGKYRTTC